MLNLAELQCQTLRLYCELLCQNESWGGQLVFTCGAESSATGLSAAVSIAGGASLVIDPDASTVKSVFRQGGLDFVVNTLDEALRVLKNEIRKQKPLSVALISEVQPGIEEMAVRGVLPDMCVKIGYLDPFFAASREFLHLAHDGGRVLQTERASQWLAARGFSESLLAVATTSELRALDANLLQIVRASDSGRTQWLRRISHYQRYDAEAGRVVWLTPQESLLVADRRSSPVSR